MFPGNSHGGVPPNCSRIADPTVPISACVRVRIFATFLRVAWSWSQFGSPYVRHVPCWSVTPTSHDREGLVPAQETLLWRIDERT